MENYEWNLEEIFKNENELEEAINKINSTKARNEMPITGINTYKEKMANESQEMIKPIIAYSFVVFISVISILNIFNTILSSIYSRKREIAIEFFIRGCIKGLFTTDYTDRFLC